ncbi:MAG: acylphosphatase [Candidatus ainarchaeum sp.]|nr:acylphosphatase [Candidatus ainarchaeum sp.]
MSNIILHATIIISGRVQGVGLRYMVLNESLKFGLVGYVKNCFDGNVEVEVEGNEEKIEDLIKFIENNPGRSKVTKITKNYSTDLENFTRFEIR